MNLLDFRNLSGHDQLAILEYYGKENFEMVKQFNDRMNEYLLADDFVGIGFLIDKMGGLFNRAANKIGVETNIPTTVKCWPKDIQ